MNIPITRVTVGKEEIDAVKNVISSGFLVKGKNVEEVEKLLAKISKRKYAVMLTSGTVSLNTATTILGLKPKDEVIVPAFTFQATATAVAYAGARLVFSDIKPDTYNLDSKDVEKRITKKTKAIITVDLFGNPYNYTSINEIAKKHNLFLLEDAAQAVGASYKKRPTGSLGDISIYSFYGSKIITSGEGGMLLTDNYDLYEKAMLYRNHGEAKDKDRKYYFTEIGYNFMPTDIQGALLLSQAKKLGRFVQLRNRAAKYYSANLEDVQGLVTPYVEKSDICSFSVYTIRILPEFGSRDEVLTKLNENGVGARVYYPHPLHLQPVWKKLGYKFKKGDFPGAELAANQVLSLPIFPVITKKEQDYIISTLLKLKKV